MTKDNQESVIKEFIDRTKLVYIYHDQKLREEGFNPSDTKSDVELILNELLTTYGNARELEVLKKVREGVPGSARGKLEVLPEDGWNDCHQATLQSLEEELTK